MAVTFPANPNVGDIVTDTDTGARWQWDGVKWVAIGGGGGGGGLADAPVDGQTYGRKDAAWVILEEIFALIGQGGGGDGSGGLSLKPIPGADPPVMVVGADGFVSLSEQGRFFYGGNAPYDTFMSFLGDYPKLSLSRTSYQVYVPIYMQSMMGTVTGTTPYIEIFNAENTSTIIRVWDENWANELFTLDRTGSLKLAGALTLPTNATQPLQAVTLQQVQSLIAAGGGGGIPEPSSAGNWLRTGAQTWLQGLPLAGGTLTGPGFLTINPLTAQASEHVFTVNVPGKQYQFMIAGDGRTWLGGYSPYGIFFDATTAKFGKPVIFESTVTLNANAASAMQAVPLRQVESLIAAGGGAGGPYLPVNDPTALGTLTLAGRDDGSLPELHFVNSITLGLDTDWNQPWLLQLIGYAQFGSDDPQYREPILYLTQNGDLTVTGGLSGNYISGGDIGAWNVLSGRTLRLNRFTTSQLPTPPAGPAYYGTVSFDDTKQLLALWTSAGWKTIPANGGDGGGIPEPTTAGSFLRTNTGTWVAGLPLTAGQTNALTGPLQLASAAGGGFPATSLLFGTDTATPVSQIAQGAIAGGLYIGAGATRTNLGQWIARVVTPVGIRCESGSIDFFAHSGMTVGNSFIPSMQLQVSTSRVQVMGVGFGMPVLAAAPTSTANGVMYYNSANHTLNVYVNNAWTALGAGAQIITVADEATAITQSAANPNNFYVWS